MTEPPFPPDSDPRDPNQGQQPGRPSPGPSPYGQPQYPGPQYPGAQDPGQQYPGQQYPGPAYPGQAGGPAPYPGQPYPGQPYPGQPYPGQYPVPGQPGSPDQRPGVDLRALLGARALRRPDVRFGASLSGAGAALALIGVFIWSVGYFVKGFGIDFADDSFQASTHGEGRRFLGFVLFLGLAVLGYALLITRRRGPLATAGTVVSALGVPLALGFAFLDIGATVSSGDFPINLDAVYLISIVVWLVSYVAVPGARGRSFYLAAAALALPAYVGFKVAGTSSLQFGASVFGDGDGGGDQHTGALTALFLLFGLAYYAVAWLLDRSGRAGVATALLYPAFAVTVGGLIVASDPFGQVGIGAATLVVGVAVALYGGRYGRRFTTWAWSAGAVVGVVVMVTKIDPEDKYWLIGVLLLVIGLAGVVAGHVAAGALGEPADIEEPVA